MLNWVFEIELFICIKMDLALDNQQRLIFDEIQIKKKNKTSKPNKKLKNNSIGSNWKYRKMK